jgi:hypothetical protein
MQNMFCSLIDFKKRIKVVGIMVRYLDLESTRNPMPEVRFESSDEGSTLFCFRNSVLG